MPEQRPDSHLRQGNMALLWRIAVVGFVVAVFTVSARPTFAQSATCRALQTQLAQIETGRGAAPSAQFLQYDRAIRDQQIQIRKTERASRANVCQFRRTNRCQRINDSLGKMYANLQALERTKATLAPRGGTAADRANIIRSMNRNGCGTQATRQANVEPDQPRRRTLLEQIFGTKTYSSQGGYSTEYEGSLPGSGTYRTLCVRRCDGYYFPISFSTTPNRFEDDLSQCQQMCPGADTGLFYHTMPGGDAENAISYRTGEPYADLTNAFSYRKQIDPQCTCRSTTSSFEELAGSTDNDVRPSMPDRPAFALPQFRQDSALGEETLQSREGNMTLEKLVALAKGNEGDVAATGKGTIRIVGPAFFPVQ